jgi:NTP pyrophosphatase (non-canonical NTP hydrolase)
MKRFYISNQTITMLKTSNDNLENFTIPDSITIDGKLIELEEKDLEWFKNNNFKSKYNNNRYVFKKSFIRYIENKKQLKMEFKNELNQFDKIRSWAENRGIYKSGDPKTQYIKLQEEAGELAKAILKNDQDEIVDALGDCVVVLVSLSHLLGYKLEDCIESAYNEIKDRSGKMKNGTFEKNN